MNHETQWPDDAPEWADALNVIYSQGECTVIGRHKVITHIERTNPTEKLICPRCNVDRGVFSCPDNSGNCPMKGEAQVAMKPAKQKIDWSKVPLSVMHRVLPKANAEDSPRTDWIAWNCDEHTRGNPLPDGLVVEWFGSSNDMFNFTPTWQIVTRFRIVGVQDGFE